MAGLLSDERKKKPQPSHRHFRYHRRYHECEHAVPPMLSAERKPNNSTFHPQPAPCVTEKMFSWVSQLKNYKKWWEIINHYYFKPIDFGLVCYMRTHMWKMVPLHVYIIVKYKIFGWNKLCYKEKRPSYSIFILMS